jgi:hypothetical protein
LERQHIVFIAAAAAIFGALIVVGLFFNPLKSDSSVAGNNNDTSNDPNVIKARIGYRLDIRYSSAVVGLIEKLPSKNNLTLEVSSQLHNTNLAGLKGEIRYTGELITYVQNGEKKTVKGDDFSSVQYRFAPDKGNMTTYSYQNVEYTSTGDNSQLVTSFVMMPSAKVGDRYTVKLLLDAGTINYAIGEKTIEVVP